MIRWDRVMAAGGEAGCGRGNGEGGRLVAGRVGRWLPGG